MPKQSETEMSPKESYAILSSAKIPTRQLCKYVSLTLVPVVNHVEKDIVEVWAGYFYAGNVYLGNDLR